MTQSLQPTSDFLRFPGQILVMDSSGKWVAAIRRIPFDQEVPCFVLLNVTELLKQASCLTTVALIAATPEQSLELAVRLRPYFFHKQFACWIVGEKFDSEMTLWIERAGFCGVLSSLADLSRWHERVRRFFYAAPPVDWTLEQRIEHQYPWRSSLK